MGALDVASHTAPSELRGSEHAPPDAIPPRVDAVVIGSGMGGLAAAGLLARHGLSIVVLERQHAAGGCLSAFHHDGYAFDVGLHYVSNWGPNGLFPRVLHAIGAEVPPVHPLDPDGYDTLCFPDFTFRVPASVDLYRERLLALFPREARGIDRYVQGLRDARALIALSLGGPGLAQRLRSGLRALRYTHGTLASFLDRCTHDPMLRAVLAAQNGIYGEPPSRAALIEHLLAVSSYIIGGAYFPSGGSAGLAKRLIDAIVRQGGRVITDAEVTRVLIDQWRVRGVAFRLAGEQNVRTIEARVVVSDADLKHTLLNLVGPQYLRPWTARRTREYEMANAFGGVYLGVARDLRREGRPVTNYWLFSSYDLERVYREARAGRFDPAPACFVSLTSLKDPDNTSLAPPGISNVELLTIAPASPEAWGTTAEEFTSGKARQNERYLAIREAFTARLVHAAERVLPGLAQDIVHCEISTPLTHWKYTGATGGTPYGIAQIPSQVLWRRPGTTTDVENLYLCGASTRFGGGLLPVMLSGVQVAARVVGRQVLAEIAEGTHEPAR